MWPTRGQRGYISRSVSGVPTTQHGDNNQKLLCGPHVGKVDKHEVFTTPHRPSSWDHRFTIVQRMQEFLSYVHIEMLLLAHWWPYASALCAL